MFGKKVLSIISLALLGSQVSGKMLSECTGDTTCGAAATTGYCYKNKRIYKSGSGCYVSGTPVTSSDVTENVYLFEGDTPVTLGASNGGTVGTPGDLVMFQCFADGANFKCARTYGYAQIDDSYCTISANAAKTNECVAVSGGTCEAVSDTGSLYENTGAKFCLVDSGTTEGSAVDVALNQKKNYLMKIPGANVFTDSVVTTKSIVIQSTQYAITMQYLTAGEDYCLSSTGYVVTDRKVDFCGDTSNSCAKYYSCDTNGLCDDTTNPPCTRDEVEDACNPSTGANCNQGYYITSDQAGTTLVDGKNPSSLTGTLWDCPLNAGTTGGTCNKKTDVVGFVPNKSSYSDVIPYIKCVYGVDGANIKNSCSAILASAITGATDCTGKTGDLIKDTGDQSKIKICVDEIIGHAVPLAIDNTSTVNGNYFVSVNSINVFAGSVAVGDYYAIVSVDGEKATLASKSDPAPKYRYARSNKIYDKAGKAGVCTVASGGSPSTIDTGVDEFKLDLCPAIDKVNYYTKQ